MTDASPRPTRPTTVDTTSIPARILQVVMGVVLTVISVLLMITTHRMQLDVLGLDLPVGLLLGALFQIVACVFLYAATGARLPLLVLGGLWGLLAAPFLGNGAGGGVLMPAVIGDQPQYSGWIVQGLGIAIPFLALLAITLWRHRRP
ncbi:MAG: hypothetical protein ACTIMA_13680 [Brachybacterium tyrofermentans]|uniref:Histidine kinase n=1 Tax=Brachybacterium tyrofermentans TaxID=47848 RepID=A0ABW0FCD1_9MICO|nr:hypothetical protein [Brachybacterium tyrofermentans]SLN03559.1 hypothetical protein FM103_14940 [Corynebacterium xerosis]